MKKEIKLDISKLYGFKLTSIEKSTIEPKIGKVPAPASTIEPKIGKVPAPVSRMELK